MPRTIPGAIAAKTGSQSLRLLWLVEWELSGGTQRLSSGEAVTFQGNAYQANRVISIGGLTAQYIDRSKREFGKITIKLDNLADNGSSAFPFTVLDASQVFEDAIVRVHLFDLDANDGVANLWFGHSGRPTFNPSDKTVDVSASFLWDSREVVMPARRIQQENFGTLEGNRKKKRSSDKEDETVVPLVYGVSNIKTRPLLYSARVENGYLHANFIVSGCHTGQPFQANDLVNARLFDVTGASEIEFLTGSSGQAAPGNKTRFPDGQAHPLVAYAYASFPVTENNKDSLDNLKADDIKILLANGRPLIDTGLPSENPVLILKDVLRDARFGLGLANSAFDSTAVTNAANYVETRYQVRVELSEQMSLADFVARMLSDAHCCLTFNNGLIQIKHKSNAESSVATFATIDSGSGGRTIHNDEVLLYEKDSSEIINQVTITYRKKNRHERQIILYDTPAQKRAGGNIQKPVDEEVDSFIHDENDASINGTIILREEQNQNLFIKFSTPLIEGLDVAPGDIIIVKSPDIFNNASNDDFRVIAQTFDTGEEPLCHFECQVYKPAVYDDTTAGIGVDLLRGSDDTSRQGRPPDVTPGTLQVVDITTNDTEGKNATIRATWTYPVVDLASEQTDNVFREYPISALQLWWKYTDESIHQARLGAEVKYPTATADFEIDYKKNKSIEVFFVALGHNRSRGPLGYIPDETKETWLTSTLSATAVTANVNGTGMITVNDFAFIENEIVKVTAKTTNTVTFQSSGGNRAPQLNTTAIAHPSGTELTVAKQSYPSLIIPLTPPRFTYPIMTGLVARQREDGVRFAWADPNADNKEVFYLYWSIDFDALTNAAKLGSATPTWYTTDPNSPPAGVNLIKTDALSHKVLQEVIGAAGTLVMARVAARNGKHNFSSQLSASVSNKLGDDFAPTIGSAPNPIWKRNGLRVKCPLPTSSMKTFPTQGKVEIVIRAKNGVGTILGYLNEASGTYSASGSEIKIDVGIQKAHTFNLKKKDFKDLFAGVVSLEVYFYVSNAVGTSLASPIATLTIAAMENDSAEDDDDAPTTLPTPKFKFKPRGLVGSFDMAAITDKRQIQFIEWNINDGTNSLNIDDPDSLAFVSGTNNWYVRGREAQLVVPLSKRQLQKIFGTGKTIKVRYRVTNSRGTTTSAESTGIAIDALGDFSDKKSFVSLVKNGMLTQDRVDQGGTSNQLRNWEKCNTNHNRPVSGNNVISTTDTTIEWDKAGRRLRFEENVPTRYLFYDLGKILIPGQFLSVYFIAQVDTGTPTPTFKLRLMADVDTNADLLGDSRVADHDAEVVFNTLQLNTSYQEIGMSIKLKDDAYNNQGSDETLGHWLVLEISGGGASVIRITDISVLDGLTPAPAIRAVRFDRENFDTSPVVTQGGTGIAIPPGGENPAPGGAIAL